MEYKSDIEIAQSVKLQPIASIAERLGLQSADWEPYGRYKAKLHLNPTLPDRQPGKVILVTALTPTPAGEGKTTVSIGLLDALQRLQKKAVGALREPSLGPVFGLKGGAAGGGRAQIAPMEDINLHFTGDFHAITSAHNLLAALVDNHIYQGNGLRLDPRRVTWKRSLDVNDRQLRNIVTGLGGRTQGMPREDGFEITAASEIMATLCLASDLPDLQERLGQLIVGYDFSGQAVRASQVLAPMAMTALLREALQPNLVQTLEGAPVLVHGGPFANIAHGCNSLLATRLARRLGDYVVTEAGFGADLGAEKFLDIKCRLGHLQPAAVVIVATLRALKYHGGVALADLQEPDLMALERGLPNLLQHIENITQVFGLPAVVAINRFPNDAPEELELVAQRCSQLQVQGIATDVWAQGGPGGEELAREVLELCQRPNQLQFAYPLEASIPEKLDLLVRRIYRGQGVEFTPKAQKEIALLEGLGCAQWPICVAKTQYSFSDNPKLLGAPRDFKVTVRHLKPSAGAGFIVALTGEILTMPGLPAHPAAERIRVDAQGRISGLS